MFAPKPGLQIQSGVMQADRLHAAAGGRPGCLLSSIMSPPFASLWSTAACQHQKPHVNECKTAMDSNDGAWSAQPHSLTPLNPDRIPGYTASSHQGRMRSFHRKPHGHRHCSMSAAANQERRSDTSLHDSEVKNARDQPWTRSKVTEYSQAAPIVTFPYQDS
jgi:hypothetical protein